MSRRDDLEKHTQKLHELIERGATEAKRAATELDQMAELVTTKAMKLSLNQLAARLDALAIALSVETRVLDPEGVGWLARHAKHIATVGVIAIVSHVGTGALEKVGADVVDKVVQTVGNVGDIAGEIDAQATIVLALPQPVTGTGDATNAPDVSDARGTVDRPDPSLPPPMDDDSPPGTSAGLRTIEVTDAATGGKHHVLDPSDSAVSEESDGDREVHERHRGRLTDQAPENDGS